MATIERTTGYKSGHAVWPKGFDRIALHIFNSDNSYDKQSATVYLSPAELQQLIADLQETAQQQAEDYGAYKKENTRNG